MPKDPVSTIDDYLSRQPDAARKALEQVRKAIGRAIPGATESISYQIPAYRLGTSPVVFFAGWKEHYSFYPARASLVAAFATELEPYSISKGTIRFPLTEKVPARLIARLAKFLFVEASARAALKRTRSSKASASKAPERKLAGQTSPAKKKASARAPAQPGAKVAKRVRSS